MTRRQVRMFLFLGALFISLLCTAASPAVASDVPGYSLTVDPNPANWGENFIVSWTRPQGAGDGFIGIFDSDRASPSDVLAFTYPNSSGTSGAVTLQTPEPGGYWVGWVSTSDSQFKAMSFFSSQLNQTVPQVPGYSITVENIPYGPGDEVTVNWTKPAGAGYGYIGIYESVEDGEPGGGLREGVGSFIDFRYATPPGNSGTVTFFAPEEPGSYAAAWVSADDSEYKRWVSFAVVGEGAGGEPDDDEPPTVELTHPENSDTVSGTVTVSADADDNVGVSHVHFKLDGVNLGEEVESAPYTIEWDTTTVANGTHVLTAEAHDEAGNETTSEEVTVTVSNIVVPPGPFGKSTPANGSTGTPRVPTLSWAASTSATSYEYCVDTSNNSNCDTTWVSTAGTSVAVGGLNGGTGYSWQVRSRNSTGTLEADGGVWWSFTTSAGSHINVAAAINGGVASASSTINAGYSPSGTNNGDRKGVNWGNGGGWNDGTNATFPDWLQVDFAGPQTIDEIDVFTVQDDYANPVEPGLGLPFSLYGITHFQVQYWDGLSWAIVPGGDITGNNQVWRQVAFGAITTTKIRILVTGALASWSRITEVEAYSDLNVVPGAFAKNSPANGAAGISINPPLNWGTSSGATSYEYCIDTSNNNSCDTSWASTANTNAVAGGLSAGVTYFWQVRARNGAGTVEADLGSWFSFTTALGGRVNVAAAANGGVASASTTVNSNYPASAAINGDRRGLAWGNGGGWNDGTQSLYPDFLQVDFAAPQTIGEIDVFTVQDNFASPAEPALGMSFTLYGITTFEVQYWNGLTWVTVPGGNIIGNNQVWRQISFAPVTTARIRVNITGALNSYSRITEVEAYSDVTVAPGSFGKSSPANAAAGQPLVPTLSWGASTAATSYEYCVDNTNNNTCDGNWITVSGTSTALGGMNAGTYFWQVRARNGNGTTDADGGTWWGFTTSSSVVNAAANVASAANGATATASSFFSSGYAPSGAIDGDRNGQNWGNGGGWNDASENVFPDFLQINFAGPKTINEVDVFTLQDNFSAPAIPTPGMTFTQYGITSFQIQYFDGTNWVNVPGGIINGNTLVWKRIFFPALTTTAIRINVTGALNSYSRITEVEAY